MCEVWGVGGGSSGSVGRPCIYGTDLCEILPSVVAESTALLETYVVVSWRVPLGSQFGFMLAASEYVSILPLTWMLTTEIRLFPLRIPCVVAK